MKICIDGLGLSQLQGTGLYTYTYELMENLLEIYPQPKYHLIWEADTEAVPWKKYDQLTYSNLKLDRRKNEDGVLKDYLEEHQINIHHMPNNGFIMPKDRSEKTKYIITVHELTALSKPDNVDKKYGQKFRTVIKRALNNAHRVIAVSQFVKGELQRHFDLPSEKIEVIYPGYSKRFRPMDIEYSRDVLERKYAIQGDYILYAGSIHKRKNLSLLIQAFKEVVRYYPALKLVIVGKRDGKRTGYYQEMKVLTETLNIEKDVIFTGTIDYKDMPYIYNGARCFIHLSEYEGFPLSVVEAIGCHIPVISSRIPPMEEIFGEGIDYLDTADVRTLKELIMKRIAVKQELEEIKKLAYHLEKDFSWENTIKELVKVYESIV